MARSELHASRPITPVEMEAIRKSARKLSSMERRAFATIDSLLGELARKSEPLKESGESDFDGREKVLVVVAWDGWTEVYAEHWMDVKVVEQWPWEDDELAIPETYQRLHYPGKLRATAYAKLTRRASLLEVVTKYAEHQERMDLIQTVRDKIERLTTK
jgi:hypothetical protein